MHQYINSFIIYLFIFLFLLFQSKVVLLQQFSIEYIRQKRSQELYEVRIFEGAPIRTKATLNEAFDRALLPFNSCFAQMDSDLDWLDFDPLRLIFETISEIPQNNSSRPAQFAILHLLCPTKKHSLHFSVHITRRNRHAPKFLYSNYKFYAPIDLPIGAEIGKVQVQDQDPIIYNSQVQLSILHSSTFSSIFGSQKQLPRRSTNNNNNLINSNENEEQLLHWDISKEGIIIVKKSLNDLKLYKPYQLRLLAIDFGSPQLFSLTNVSIIPVSVSAPQNVRINIANINYQIFQWDLPLFGIPERFRLILKRKPLNKIETENKLILHQKIIEATETITMTKVKLLNGEQLELCIWSVDSEGETPSEIINFQIIDNLPQCNGQCYSPNVGLPMCYYSNENYLKQFSDSNGNLNCLCFAGYSGPQCNKIEYCPAQRVLEQYGGVDWPETSVNNSAFIPCPYNEDGRRLERNCGWNSQTELPIWATVSQQILSKQTENNGGNCRTQSSVLVHLGVLANYGQRNEQTLSGLQSVMRFLSTLLQFPAFQLNIHSAHFDSKIAEHVAQVLDILVSKNFSALGGNNFDNTSIILRKQIINYTKEFMRILPNPFLLQSPSGGLQMRVWDILPSINNNELLFNEQINEQIKNKELINNNYNDDDDEGIQIGNCFVQPPNLKNNNYARIARSICFKNTTTTLFPNLNEFEIINEIPILILEIRKISEQQQKRIKKNKDNIISKNTLKFQEEIITEEIYDREPLLIGFRLPLYLLIEDNYTCAYYDYNFQIWSISGVNIISRENRPNGQILLCELYGLKSSGVFTALPERLFEQINLGITKILIIYFENYGPIISSFLIIILCLILLFSSNLFLSSNYSKQQQQNYSHLTLIFSLFLLHIFHFILLIKPQLTNNYLFILLKYWPNSNILFLIFQFSLLSFITSIAILNSLIYSFIINLETKTTLLKLKSKRKRLFIILLFVIVFPLIFSLLTLYFNCQIIEGLDTDEPQLQLFNWLFCLLFLLPLIFPLGIAMGFGVYSFWYSNKLLANTFSLTTTTTTNIPTSSTSNWPSNLLESPSTNSSSIDTTPLIIQRRLLNYLEKSSGLSLLLLLFSIANLLILLQPKEILKNIFLFIIHLFTLICLYLFNNNLIKIKLIISEQNNNQQIINNNNRQQQLIISNNLNNEIKYINNNNNYKNGNGIIENNKNNGRMMLTIQEHGQLQPISPKENFLFDKNNCNERQFINQQNLFIKRNNQQQQQLITTTTIPIQQQQRFSGTISTSIEAQDSSILDSLGSLEDEKTDENILILEEWKGDKLKILKNKNIIKLNSNFFAKSEEEEEDDEDLNDFLENNKNILRRKSDNGKEDQQNNNNKLSHPLVSVV